MSKEIKLVVADIDGTVYGSERIFTKRTRDAINALRAKGIRFGLASGRDIRNMRLYPKAWGFEEEFDVYIGMNGAMLYDCETQTLSISHVMSYEDVVELFQYMEHFNFNAHFFAENGVVYVYRMDEAAARSMDRNKEVETFQVLDGDLSKLNGIGCFKICYSVPAERMEDVETYVREHPLERFNGFKTQPVYYELMYKGINKSVGVMDYCRMKGLAADEVMAFGDTSNDVEMLACCHGVCLLNGSQDAKDAAEAVTEETAENDGMAIYLEKHLLNR